MTQKKIKSKNFFCHRSRPRVLDHRDRRGFSPPWRRSPPRGPRLPGPERRDV